MPERVESVSGKYLNIDCPQCSTRKAQIVQTQHYIGVGGRRFLGQGSRRLKAECSNCKTLMELTDLQRKKSMRLKFREGQEDSSTELSLSPREKIYFPILDKKRREQIRADNRKEGVLSGIVGIVIGLIVIPLFPPLSFTIGSAIMVLSALGAMYAIFEDPERKHRDLIKAGKDL